MSLRPTRRQVMATAIVAGALPMLPRSAAAEDPKMGAATAFSFDTVRQMARDLAKQPYAPAAVPDAELLETIDYDLHNQITYRPDRTLWGDVAGAAKVRFFHPGRYFKEPVDIFAVQDGKARQLEFSDDLFDMPPDHPAHQLKQAGFAGFRVMDPDEENDWMAVLGASYFRTSGYSGQFGLSARGIAIDSGGPGPEEFPRFSKFWLEPAPEGGIVIYALLEGPRVTGAYRLDTRHQPGKGVFQTIDTDIFLRGDVERLGIAPLTSMFWYAKNNRFVGPDWRPEIHDSDGLEMWLATGERIWRPLNNPPRVMANAFAAPSVKGFGLGQRERSFEQYQDDGVFYEKRATAWIQPRGDWGPGSVMLIELPTNDEIHDNIVAFWNPGEPAAAGKEFSLSYTLDWVNDSPPQAAARFIATRVGAGGVPGQVRPPNTVKYVLDLDGKGLEGLDRSSGVEAVVEASRGTLRLVYAFPIATTERWRVTFDLDFGDDPGDEPIDLRLFLRHEGQAMSETWIYQAFPSQLRALLAQHA
ncbi:MAG TPA: glucan biosynthesis protein D [Amaricoccus sp.]|nr:glucan biosynthesis protein D [Amaricoccus sp.]